MGNKFRFSSMMPNAWFYKLKDTRIKIPTNPIPNKRTTNSIPEPPPQQQPYHPNRTSYYFPTQARPEKPKPSNPHVRLDPPRKSQRLRRKPSQPPAISDNLNCNCKSSTAAPELRRIKIRPSSPRLAYRRIEATRNKLALQQRKCLTDSFAIIKTSSDPERDFKESMLEMIFENNIRSERDLEELLACYLSLNSDEYQDVIVKVFKELWFELASIRVH